MVGDRLVKLVTTRRVMRDGWRATEPEEATALARRLRLRRRRAEREEPDWLRMRDWRDEGFGCC